MQKMRRRPTAPSDMIRRPDAFEEELHIARSQLALTIPLLPLLLTAQMSPMP